MLPLPSIHFITKRESPFKIPNIILEKSLSSNLQVEELNLIKDSTNTINIHAKNSCGISKNESKNILPVPNIISKENPKDDNKDTKNSNSKLARKKFTEEEDDRLKMIVQKMGSKRWNEVAQYMPGRSGRQCRDRYQNYLVPGVFNGEWSKEEDELLIKLYEEFGSKWSRMTFYFTNRNANALKNRWNYFISKRLPIIRMKNNQNENKEIINLFDQCDTNYNLGLNYELYDESFNTFDFESMNENY